RARMVARRRMCTRRHPAGGAAARRAGPAEFGTAPRVGGVCGATRTVRAGSGLQHQLRQFLRHVAAHLPATRGSPRRRGRAPLPHRTLPHRRTTSTTPRQSHRARHCRPTGRGRGGGLDHRDATGHPGSHPVVTAAGDDLQHSFRDLRGRAVQSETARRRHRRTTPRRGHTARSGPRHAHHRRARLAGTTGTPPRHARLLRPGYPPAVRTGHPQPPPAARHPVPPPAGAASLPTHWGDVRSGAVRRRPRADRDDHPPANRPGRDHRRRSAATGPVGRRGTRNREPAPRADRRLQRPRPRPTTATHHRATRRWARRRTPATHLARATPTATTRPRVRHRDTARGPDRTARDHGIGPSATGRDHPYRHNGRAPTVSPYYTFPTDQCGPGTKWAVAMTLLSYPSLPPTKSPPQVTSTRR